ncbi:MAG: metallophosphoesterase family protein [Anaerolineales bacterium]
MLRIAVLSDIHGNTIALDAVLADIEARGGADSFWVLGDFSAIGYDPVTPIQRVMALPKPCFVRGNTDRFLYNGQRPPPTREDVLKDPAKLEQFAEVAASFAWSQGALSALGRLGWLANLPLEQRLTLPDGTRLLGVHASPGRDDGAGINPVQSEADLRGILSGCQADLVLVGHTHVPLDVTVDGIRAVNLGSVSNPVGEDLRAKYVTIEADKTGYELRARQVAYDTEAVVAAIRASYHPTADFLIKWIRGQVKHKLTRR